MTPKKSPPTCKNCGEPYGRYNAKAVCPVCKKHGCDTCVTHRDNGTCCCAPYDNGGNEVE